MNSSSSDIICDGYLQKRSSSIFMLWNKRYFVLQRNPVPIQNLRIFFEKNVIASGDASSIDEDDDVDNHAITVGDSSAYEQMNRELFETIAMATVSGKGLLFYYEDEQSTDPLGILRLSQVVKCSVSKMAGKLHTIQLKTSNKTVYLSASSKDDMEKWKNCLQEASDIGFENEAKQSADYHAVYQMLVNKQVFGDNPRDSLELVVPDSDGNSRQSVGQFDDQPEEHVKAAVIDIDQPEQTEEEEQDASNPSDDSDEAVGIEDSEHTPDTPINEVAEVNEITAAIDTPEKSSNGGFMGYLFPCATSAGVESAVASDDEIYQVTDKEYLMKGWLLKQSDYLKKWNKRFVVLYPNRICYFRPSSLPVSVFDVEFEIHSPDMKARPTLIDYPSMPFAFRVDFGSEAHIILASDGEDSLQNWLEAFKSLP